MILHATVAAFPGVLLFEVSRTVIATCAAGIALFLIGVFAVKKEIAQARGLNKIVTLANLCFATPLAVFSMEHFFSARGIMQLVPKFMPWPLFWTYFVGCALLAASLSIATRIQVQWSGLLFGIMMFLFVAMMDLPATVAQPHNRIFWALMFREASFGSAGWMFAGAAMGGSDPRGRSFLITVGRIIIGIATMFYGIEHFLHPVNVPGVPLEKLMPTWIPGRMLIGYFTGALLIVGGACIPLGKKTRTAATYLGSWIFLVVLLVYGPILIASLLDPTNGVRIEGINYFFDTLLYAGTILAVAKAVPSSG